jgi:hypothetical protein
MPVIRTPNIYVSKGVVIRGYFWRPNGALDHKGMGNAVGAYVKQIICFFAVGNPPLLVCSNTVQHSPVCADLRLCLSDCTQAVW